jgi:GT2 family glycosyltransferase
VGVIVPIHGEARWLEPALRSVLEQDPPPDEVVVVDDGTSPPVALPPALAGRCRLVRREARGGPAAARNVGLETLAADLVAFADADDVWRPGKLAAQLAALERHPRAVLCFGRARVVGAGGEATGEAWEAPPPGPIGPPALAPLVFERNPVVTSTVLARASAVGDAGGFDPDVPDGVEDLDLWLRLAAAGATFVCEPRAEIDYRRHPGGLTADVARLAEGRLAVHDRHAGLVGEATGRRVRARDLVTLARGRIRQRRYAEARAALARAGALAPLSHRERAIAAILAVPGARAALGRRAPYGR